MSRDQIILAMQEHLDQYPGTELPANLHPLVAGDDELQKVWTALRETDAIAREFLREEMDVPQSLHQGIMDRLHANTASRSHRRHAVVYTSMAIAAIFLAIVVVNFPQDNTQRESPAPTPTTADVLKVDFPRLRIPETVLHPREKLEETRRSIIESAAALLESTRRTIPSIPQDAMPPPQPKETS